MLELRLNRPAARNAIDTAMVLALLEHLRNTDARVVLLGATDPTAFCAGADLKLSDAERAQVSDLLYELYRRMVELSVLILVVLQGPAVGGGAQIAVAADLRIADPTASIRFMGPAHGLAVGAWALGSLVGRGRALDLCLNRRVVAADEALALGLVDRVVSDPWATAREMGAHIARLDRGAVARVKRIVCDGGALLSMLAQERDGNRSWMGSVSISEQPGHD